MQQINVTALAQAAVAGKIKPKYTEGLSYMMGQENVVLESTDFVDDATAAQMAQLLGGTVVQLKPRSTWGFEQVNNTPPEWDVPLQNFIAFAGQANLALANRQGLPVSGRPPAAGVQHSPENYPTGGIPSQGALPAVAAGAPLPTAVSGVPATRPGEMPA